MVEGSRGDDFSQSLDFCVLHVLGKVDLMVS